MDLIGYPLAIEMEDNARFDRRISVATLLNYVRANEDYWNNVLAFGTVSLTNTKAFPFNNSLVSVALPKTAPNNRYAVFAEITSSAGNGGEVAVSNKLVNGFKIGFTGSATSAVVNYIVIGGITT